MCTSSTRVYFTSCTHQAVLIGSYVCACACVRACVSVCVRVCMCMCVHVRACACVCVRVCERVSMCKRCKRVFILLLVLYKLCK